MGWSLDFCLRLRRRGGLAQLDRLTQVPQQRIECEGQGVDDWRLAPAREDARLYRVGGALEALLEQSWEGPLLSRAPELEEAR